MSALPVVQTFGLVFGCLHAREHQKNVVVGFTIVVSPISRCDMMADLDAIHTSNRSLRTVHAARASRVILCIIELEQACPNHRHKLLLRMSGSICSHKNRWILRLLNRFLVFSSQITFVHHVKGSFRVHNESLLLSTLLLNVKKHCSRDSG